MTEQPPPPPAALPDAPAGPPVPVPAPAAAGIPPLPAGPPKRPRPRLRAALRWTSAVLVFGALAGAVGYGLTLPERTDLPGLTTLSDGRWSYPELKRPALPAGAPRPFDERNTTQNHHVDPRDLLLPAPNGARPDNSVAGDDGWLPMKKLLEEYAPEDREAVGEALTDNSCRHIAARGWTMPDGTRTRIYLMQFNTGALADYVHRDHLSSGMVPAAAFAEAPESELDEDWPASAGAEDTTIDVFEETGAPGKRHARHAYIVAGDVLALVAQSKPGNVADVPFRQTLILQDQLLG
ncbi:hypothetical protein [Streptomyces meridianus]|uniref:Uncharacterized protein n=1 Tax=Streptomyces meridianus TaxID=2938945 RepID=A0ABT0X5W0_9ACTN|nr:hypothetical protein [Streptomyces meridianus]MCM2577308.1 hypothetical protein [Streptomyces meridianus]